MVVKCEVVIEMNQSFKIKNKAHCIPLMISKETIKPNISMIFVHWTYTIFAIRDMQLFKMFTDIFF